MGLTIVKLKSSNTIHLLADGLNFKIVSKSEGATDTIVESSSKRILSTLNGGIEVEKIIKRINAGEKLDDLDKTVSISLYGSTYSTTNFMILTVIVNGADTSTWTGTVLRDEGLIHLHAGVIEDILAYLINAGVKPKQRSYYIVKHVEKLPITTRTDIAWMLTEDDGDKPAGSAWRWDGEKWEPVEDSDDSHFPDDPAPSSGGGNFIISVDEPPDLEPGDVWGRIDEDF